MAHTAYTWSTGDLISAARLNNLEVQYDQILTDYIDQVVKILTDYIDQAVKITSSPTFVTPKVTSLNIGADVSLSRLAADLLYTPDSFKVGQYLIMNNVVSANVRMSHDAEVSVDSIYLTKFKTITLTKGLRPNVRVTFQVKAGSADTNLRYQLYKSGTAISGTVGWTNSTSYVSVSFDLTTDFAAGNTIELWMWRIGAYYTCYGKEMRVCYDNDLTVPYSNS